MTRLPRRVGRNSSGSVAVVIGFPHDARRSDSGRCTGCRSRGAACSTTPRPCPLAHVQFRGEQHAEWRRDEIEPDVAPGLCRKSRGGGARRIHAHARERRFEGDVEGDERTGEDSGVAIECAVIGGDEHGQHQSERDRQLGAEADTYPARAGLRHRVVHRRVPHEHRTANHRRDHHAERAAYKLSEHVEHRVP